MPTDGQKMSRKHERDLADWLGGRVVPGSGSSWSHDADVRAGNVLIEAKATDKKSYSVRDVVWRKLEKEALRVGATPLLAVRIGELDLAVLSMDDYRELMEKLEEYENGSA